MRAAPTVSKTFVLWTTAKTRKQGHLSRPAGAGVVRSVEALRQADAKGPAITPTTATPRELHPRKDPRNAPLQFPRKNHATSPAARASSTMLGREKPREQT